MLTTAAQAQSIWHGPGFTTNTSDYNLNTNWGSATSPIAPGQSAVFRNAGQATVTVTAGPISPDSWTFNANARSFNVSGADVNFSLAGANGGIINKANSGQTISIGNNIGETLAGVRIQQTGSSTLVLSGANTYTGNTTISAGTLQVTNNSSVGTGNVVLNGGVFQADGSSDLKFSNRFRMNAAGGAIDANGITLTLSGNIVDGAGAGPLKILDASFGSGRVIMTGNNSYTGGTTICACATLQLGTAGNSGSIVGAVSNEGAFDVVNANTSGITTVTNQSGSFMTFRNSTNARTMTIDNLSGFFGGSSLEFRQGASAANATINNNISTSTVFTNASAGSATINTIGGFGVGIVEFNKNSTAADATINNSGFNYVVFNDHATLEGAKIVNKDAGLVIFNQQSGAGNVASSITNNDHGQVHFLNQSTAGSTTITNNDFGVLDFNNRSSADNATIINSSAIGVAFLNRSTAGNAFITTNNNSATYFFDRSDGGTARFENEAGSIVDFSRSRGANDDGRINAGSIAGAGNTYIGGGNTLSVGGNDRSTEVSGVIADNNPCGCTTGRGVLEKVGLGTLVLSGANIYTGGTTITAGTLQLGNGGASGSILGDVVNNSNFAINRSDAFTFSGAISGSGGFQQIGDGATTLTSTNTYTGPTTVSAGTLIIAATGSITSDVTNNAMFSNLGTVTGSLTNAGAASNSGTITGGLTNTAGTTTNTGTIDGGAAVAGGTLNSDAATSVVNGGLTNAGTVNARNQVNGAILNQNAGLFTVAGNLAGNGSFTNGGTARLLVNLGDFTGVTTLTNNSTNVTGIDISASRTLSTTGAVINAAGANIAVGGTLTAGQLLTNSGTILVNNGGTLNATVGGIANTATGAVTVALGGTVNDDLDNFGVVANNGAYNAMVATNTGSITNSGIWTGNIASNAGTITNNLTWTGSVSNAGTFINNAGATVSGLLTNTAGSTVNNGALNGGAFISGGLLTGMGTAGNTTIGGGGMFAPGNGTPGSFMTVTGNLAFLSGALYLVGLNPATASLAKVTGTASLNGSAGAAFLAGNYLAKQYTVLTAAGGVSGRFSSFDTLGVPTGFQTSLNYDANNVFLDLDLVLAKYAGLSVNQQNVANALVNFFNATGGIPSVFGTLTPGGLAQASGELATGSQQTTFDAMNLFLGLLTDPFVAGRSGAAPPAGASQFADSGIASAYAAKGKPRTGSEREAYAAIYRKAPIRDDYDPRWSVWAAGYGGSQTTDGSAALGSNNTRSNIGGVAVGADYLFSPRTLAGFAMAGGGTGFSVNGMGSGRSDLFQAGVYVRHTAGPAYVSAALAYGWQDITTDRTVTIAGTDLLRADFNASTYSGRVEGGYRFVAPWIGGVGVTPYAAGQFTTFDLPAYAEQAIAGVNTFALSYAGKSVTDPRSELGLRTDKSFAMPNGIFTLRGRAAWAHDFNTDRNIGATFQTLPGASFVVNGAARARDAALVTGSAEIKWLNGFSFAATFEGEFSDVTRSYAGKGVARYTW